VLGFAPLAIAADGTVWTATLGGLRAFHPGGAQDSFTTRSSPLPDGRGAIAGDRIPRTRAVDHDRVRPGAARSGVRGARGAALAGAPRAPLPNPATITALGLGLRLTGEADTYRGEVYDLSGRVLATFQAAKGQGDLERQGSRGHPVKPGLYSCGPPRAAGRRGPRDPSLEL